MLGTTKGVDMDSDRPGDGDPIARLAGEDMDVRDSQVGRLQADHVTLDRSQVGQLISDRAEISRSKVGFVVTRELQANETEAGLVIAFKVDGAVTTQVDARSIVLAAATIATIVILLGRLLRRT